MQVNTGTWQDKLLAERGVTAQKTMPVDILTSGFIDNTNNTGSLDEGQKLNAQLSSGYWRDKISSKNQSNSTLQGNHLVRDIADGKNDRTEKKISFVEAEQEKNGKDQERMRTLDVDQKTFLASYLARHSTKQVALSRSR